VSRQTAAYVLGDGKRMKNTYCDENCFECGKPDCTIPAKFLRTGGKRFDVVLRLETGEELMFSSCVKAAEFCGVCDNTIIKRLKGLYKPEIVSKKDGRKYIVRAVK